MIDSYANTRSNTLGYYFDIFSNDSVERGILWDKSYVKRKLQGFRILVISCLLGAVQINQTAAKDSKAPPEDSAGLSFEEAKEIVSPITDFLAWICSSLVTMCHYILENPPAAILVSGLIGLAVALKNIKSNRETTRLQETFRNIDKSLKDEDSIRARVAFKKIVKKLGEKRSSIAKYHDPKPKDIDDAAHLNTVLKEYENMALGIKFDILDESYLSRWTRKLVIEDWNTLLPLVTEKRKNGSPSAYIEFEGLAMAWQSKKSYYKRNRKLLPARRKTQIS